MGEENNGRRYPYLFPLEASISLQPWEARGPLEEELGSAGESQTESLKVHVSDWGMVRWELTQVSNGITREVVMGMMVKKEEG